MVVSENGDGTGTDHANVLVSNKIDTKDIRALQQNPELCFKMADRVLATMVAGKIQYQKAGFKF